MFCDKYDYIIIGGGIVGLTLAKAISEKKNNAKICLLEKEKKVAIWEKEPMENLAKDGQMSSLVHKGFWHPMDTLRDKEYLENLWISGEAPWKRW